MRNWLRWLTSAALLAALAAPVEAQQRTITGRVLSADDGSPVVGAAIMLEGSRVGSISDESGAFRISAGPGEATLVVRRIGYRTQEVAVPPGRDNITIQLQTDVLGLDELVVTGRATSIARRNLANAVATIDAEAMERAPAASLEQSLQGKVAGATIASNSGAPGGGMQVRLRGVATINAESQPLYVIDGLIASNAEIPSNANAVTRAAGGSNPSLMQDAVVNRIVDINPEDIQSVEILKGPSAAAIYGSKAANGVIIITTKRGQPGEPRLRATQRLGYSALSNKLGFRQFETEEEAVAAFGEGARTFYSGGEPIHVSDHEELLAGRQDLSHETAFSVSGGSETTRYFLSGLWKDQAGIIDNTGFDKQAVRLNLDQRLGERLDLSVSTNLIHTLANRGLSNNDNSGTSFYMVFPFTPSFVDLRRCVAGSDNPLCANTAVDAYPENPFERSNPLQTASLLTNDEDVWRIMSSGAATWDALRSGPHSLQLLLRGGVDYFAQENSLVFPPELQFEPNDDGLPGTSLLSNSDNLKLNLSGNVVYTLSVPGVDATTSAGVQYEDDDLNIARVISRNLIAGKTNIDAGTNVEVRELREKVRDLGIYLQEEMLLLDERALVSFGIRGDRSSANGDPDKFFFYPKAAASYRFPDLLPGVGELKVRAAFGQSGNRPLFGQKFTPLQGTRNVEGLPGLTVVGVTGDPDIEPERQTEVEAGIDAVFFDGRASATLTVFEKTIENLLLQRELAPSSGFVVQTFNGGEMEVNGVEFSLEANPIRTANTSWLTTFTFYRDRSAVTSLPVEPFRTGGFGTALGAFEIRGPDTLGNTFSATQIVANVLEGDSVVVRPVGDANPDFQIGFSNELSIGPFQLYGLVDWQQGGTVINLTKLLFDFGQNTVDYDSDPQYVANIGPVEVDDTLTLGERRIRGFGMETRPYIEDASFVKLRELSLSYRVPDAWTERFAGARNMVLSLSGRNLLTFTDYSGLDPEVSNFGNQPIARNVDVAPFPPSRSFWVSVDVSF